MSNKTSTIAASVLLGVVLELGVGLVSGRREAWDSGVYWTTGVPLALIASALIGWRSVGRTWVWTAVIVPSQVTAMMLRSGEIGGLWPLTAALSTILSAPFVGAAFIGSKLRPRSSRVDPNPAG